MLGAIFVGLSGMNAYSKGLQTISNNVANLNTDGFKSTSVSFSDLYSVDGNGWNYEGSNQESNGMGVRLNVPITDFGSGELRQTDNDLDLALKGNGFLVLMKDGQTYYARTGQFAVDKDGYISDKVNGYHLAVLDSSNQPVAVNVNSKRTFAPVATTTVSFADNLSSSGTTASVTDIAVYDSRGGKHVWSVTFAKVVADQWTVTVKDENAATIGTHTLKFTGSVVDPATDSLTISTTPTGADAMSVELDFSKGVTSYSGGTTSTIRASSVNGNATGDLTTVTVDENGKIKLTYSNEKTDLMGAVVVADFLAPEQLKHHGNGLFIKEDNSDMRLLSSGVEGVGTLVAKQIEASNVNLSDEFGKLILVQRGYQACSQVLTTSNDMIQQLFGIRGQS